MPKNSKPTPQQQRIKRPTLVDVGKLAGVSNVAAAVVLNGAKASTRISEEARKRIIDAAKQLNYRPNIAARALIKQRTDVIGVAAQMEGGEINYYFMEVLNGILEQAAKHGQKTMVFNFKNWENASTELANCCDGRIDGMILIAPVIPDEELADIPAHTPFVSLHSNKSSNHIKNIETNEEHGAYQMTQQLIEMGHRRILHIGVDMSLQGGKRRFNGYKTALIEAGIPFEPSLHVITKYSLTDGRNSMREWLSANGTEHLPDAIFCANDAIAAGCMETLSEANIKIPQDISICGFDDSLISRTSSPQITTVRQPLRRMAHFSVDELMKLINSGVTEILSPEQQNTIVPTEIVIRNSTMHK